MSRELEAERTINRKKEVLWLSLIVHAKDSWKLWLAVQYMIYCNKDKTNITHHWLMIEWDLLLNARMHPALASSVNMVLLLFFCICFLAYMYIYVYKCTCTFSLSGVFITSNLPLLSPVMNICWLWCSL